MNSSRNNKVLLVPTVREVQQIFGELLSHGEDVTWDLLSASQGEMLKSKIDEFKMLQNNSDPMPFYVSPPIFNSIWNQRKYTNGQSLTSLFFVMVVDNVTDPKLAEQSRSWYLYPVFRCRICVDNHGENYSSLDCCMAYVSQYDCCKDWDTFLEDTRLRPGLMVTPYRGVYKLIDGQVELRTYSISGRFRQPMRSMQFAKEHCLTPESLGEASKRSIIHLDSKKRPAIYTFKRAERMCDKILHQLLVPRDEQNMTDVTTLSDSLILFTHNTNNLRLASSMIKDQNSRSVLQNQIKSDFDKISEETKSFRGIVDLVRSANEIPTVKELDEVFKPILKGPKKRKLAEMPNEVTVDPTESLQLNTVQVKGELFNLDDYGTVLKKHIVCSESFTNLINKIAENLEPEMFKLILHFTQTFMETTREELWKERKHHIATETVLYQILLHIIKNHTNMDCTKVKEQSSDILSRMRYYFASTSPNSPPELLTKCTKCIGYYRVVPL
ncbi:uncharacterized protein LOC119555113 [Drosophila subpulchrella]|uniref:uncharacterized protein LOC119555113 n=1 Tax=Drosophila subpulchrella TaxID=1486046 RepID=UPI0018A13936|nr:uncharacterized protein LOC119555113 [Drosophila subpulchrella]